MNGGIENFLELKRGLILWATIVNMYALFCHQNWYAHILIGTMRSVNFLIGVSIALWAIYRVLLTGWRLTIRLAAAFQVSNGRAVLLW